MPNPNHQVIVVETMLELNIRFFSGIAESRSAFFYFQKKIGPGLAILCKKLEIKLASS